MIQIIKHYFTLDYWRQRPQGDKILWKHHSTTASI